MADHPNLVSARQGYQAFADGDLARVSELLDDHVVWHVGGNNTLTGDYEGKEAVLSFFGRLMQETGGQDRPVLLRYHIKAGHSGGVPINEQIDNLVESYSFLFWQLGAGA